MYHIHYLLLPPLMLPGLLPATMCNLAKQHSKIYLTFPKPCGTHRQDRVIVQLFETITLLVEVFSSYFIQLGLGLS